ncbi:MAG: hypothetical protein COV70_01405 [Parcubacteria group bacterium CG11_big_fil_rev_8_21_14_0_20_39_22]|nr:MAG: hypothetical protein COV70_01405 [Parcubacteria group bacterium CG11_big_fil_rev_8_21_14_0_20_39_22]
MKQNQRLPAEMSKILLPARLKRQSFGRANCTFFAPDGTMRHRQRTKVMFPQKLQFSRADFEHFGEV